MPKLVNLGSLCIDHVYTVNHVAQTGETVASEAYSVFPGGKGLNQSLAAAKAGAAVKHVGCIGEDGRWLKDVLHEGSVDATGVRVIEGSTGHAIIQVDSQGQNAIVIVGGTNRQISPEIRQETFAGMESGDWLLLQNEINDLDTVLAQAASQDVKVAFNVAPVDGREQTYDYEKVGVLFVNEVEANALAGEEDAVASYEKLQDRYPDTTVVLTLGKDGGYCGRKGMESIHYEPYSVDVVDETAAGDSFIGYFMSGLLSDRSLSGVVDLANAAGALAVTQAGAASSIPELADVERFLNSRSN